MIKTVQDFLTEENLSLAPYAIKSSESGGRFFEEPAHPYRSDFQRDRDRIIHSRAFKRLEYKTQVFINTEIGEFRTRLTHTLEVAGIAKTIARVLGLNPTLAESIALAHDLGHTPFGHAGQDALSDLMKPYGGFEHNKQSIRVVTKLENKYPGFVGLNLCRETLKGIMKHGAVYEDNDILELRKSEGVSLESQITDLSDEIAYTAHDLEDGVESGLLQVYDLDDLSLWKKCRIQSDAGKQTIQNKVYFRASIRSYINYLASDLIHEVDRLVKDYKVESRESLKSAFQSGLQITFSAETEPLFREVKKFLFEKLYRHPHVVEMSDKGVDTIQKLFSHYVNHPDHLPDSYTNRIQTDGLHRCISDYIAGMTDRYALEKLKETIS